MSQENLEESLTEIRRAAKEYYARKSGSWKPKRDLDAERLEDGARFRRDWMDRYSSGPVKIVSVRLRLDYEKIERIRKAFEFLDMKLLKKDLKRLSIR